MKKNKLVKESHKESCPHCGANLQGAPIPEEHREAYGYATHFGRKIGIEEHDRIVCWRCPDCGKEWGR